MVIPFILSISLFYQFSMVTVLIMILSIYISVAFIPEFDHYENIGVTFLSTICFIPIYFDLFIISYEIIDSYFFCRLSYAGGAIIIFYSIMEIILNVIARIIWKDQYEITYKSKKNQ